MQIAHNERHGIVPQTIRKSVEQIELSTRVADVRDRLVAKVAEPVPGYTDELDSEQFIKIIEEEMAKAAEALDFERAAALRDQLFELKAAVG